MLQIDNPFAQFLLMGRNTGKPHLASQFIFPLQENDFVAAHRTGPGTGHAADSAAHDHHTFRLFRFRKLQLFLPACRRIDHAGGRMAFRLFSHTSDGAGRARCDSVVISGFHLFYEVGIRNQGAAQHDAIHLARIDQIFRIPRLAYFPDHEYRHCRRLLQRFRLRNVDALHLPVARDNLIASLILGTAADFKCIHAVTFQDRNEVLHIFQRIALFVPFTSRHTKNNREIGAAGLPNRIQDFTQQACPVVETAAVTVRPFVPHR